MSGSALTIRPLTDGEEEAVIALWHACGLTRPWNDPATDLAFARGRPNSDVLVGLAGDRVVASAMVGHDGHRGTMYYVSVVPAERGRGYGRQIVAAAEAWLKARGVWKANLLVRKGNEAVLGFYDELGYEAGSAQQIEKWLDPQKRADKSR
ncbi:MAG: GNAT family acetyltransferase [Hyphomonadaceae bacterium]|jgi:ribosomal protein S18 acetylase RimI-like enzyme|nr:GNAT family acetyltransferase [Hyphomonadaceae bacterium]